MVSEGLKGIGVGVEVGFNVRKFFEIAGRARNDGKGWNPGSGPG